MYIVGYFLLKLVEDSEQVLHPVCDGKFYDKFKCDFKSEAVSKANKLNEEESKKRFKYAGDSRKSWYPMSVNDMEGA